MGLGELSHVDGGNCGSRAEAGSHWHRLGGESIQDGATSNWLYGRSYWEVTPRDRERGVGDECGWKGGGAVTGITSVSFCHVDW